MPEVAALARIAADLGLKVVRPLAGGVWGATLVAGARDEQLVLKTMAGEQWSPVFERGASIANRLRETGYPAPEYLATGAAHGAAWSLQRLLPGDIPEALSESHMRQLIALAERHAGAMADRSGRHGTWFSHQAPYLEMSLRTITDTAITRALAVELSDVLYRTRGAPLLDGCAVHNDFHHRNFLAVGDDVSGYFDWEFADVGDWRHDLVTLAWWSTVMEMDAARLAVDRMLEVCEPEVLEFFAAFRHRAVVACSRLSTARLSERWPPRILSHPIAVDSRSRPALAGRGASLGAPLA